MRQSIKGIMNVKIFLLLACVVAVSHGQFSVPLLLANHSSTPTAKITSVSNLHENNVPAHFVRIVLKYETGRLSAFIAGYAPIFCADRTVATDSTSRTIFRTR